MHYYHSKCSGSQKLRSLMSIKIVFSHTHAPKGLLLSQTLSAPRFLTVCQEFANTEKQKLSENSYKNWERLNQTTHIFKYILLYIIHCIVYLKISIKRILLPLKTELPHIKTVCKIISIGLAIVFD